MNRLRSISALLCLSALIAFATPLILAAPSNLAAADEKILTTDDFRKLLVAHTWTWERAEAGPGEFKFLADGTLRHPNFVTRYKIKSLREVVIGTAKSKATMTFDPTYRTWDGLDFDGMRPVHGRRK